jgi:uncharacterized protein with HEPN domain
MRRDDALILDMLTASQKIIEFINGMDFDQFERSELVQSAVVQKIQILGEATRHITDGLKAQYPEIEWSKIIGMRNKIAHEYFNILPHVVWETIQNKVKSLIPQLEKILAELNRPTIE